MKGIKKKIRDNRFLNWLLLLSNWLFQGIPNADKTEKAYKTLFTLFFWGILFWIFYSSGNIAIEKVLIISFLIAHTFNWLVNGNISIILIHRLLLVKLSKQDLFLYIEKLQQKTVSKNWILYAASFGSICRGDLKDSSDIDISIVRKPGFKNALKSIWFALKEKKAADFNGIPLEIYISDTPENSIHRFAAEQNPVVIYDPYNAIDNYYKDKLTIEEAKKLNNIDD